MKGREVQKLREEIANQLSLKPSDRTTTKSESQIGLNVRSPWSRFVSRKYEAKLDIPAHSNQ